MQFEKYEVENNETKIMLMYLLLNNCDITKIKKITENHQNINNNTFVKIYGITTEYIDTDKIYKEIKNIKIPNISNIDSYELYTNSDKIYLYLPKEENKPLYINNMDIISNLMVIDKNTIISSNKAKPIEQAENKGFMYFVDYLLNNECSVGKWEMTFSKETKEFKIIYSTTNAENEIVNELIYYSKNWDKRNTYRLVLYTIKKAVESVEEFSPDNFKIKTLKLKK